MDERAETFIRALSVLEDSGDTAALAELYAPDGTSGNVNAGQRYTGPDGARRFWSEDRSLYDEIRSDFHAVVCEADTVALEWHRTGTGTGGNDVDYDGVSIVAFDGDRIARFTAYFDPHQVGRQAL